jgi:hypothetical protein
MAMPVTTKRIYNHWNGASAAILSYLVGNNAAQLVPIPPSRVKPPVNPMRTIPMKRRNFAKKLFVDIVYSFRRKKEVTLQA